MSCNPFKTCILFSDKRRQVVVIEKKKRYCGINKNNINIHMLRVDDCLITRENDRCDFLLLACNNEKKQAYFIELKGTDFLHGIDQLISSINILGYKINDFSINARIVVTNIYAPDLNNSRLIRLKMLLKQRGGDCKKSEINLEENI